MGFTKPQGNLAAGHKSKHWGSGLDWDAIREARSRRLDWEVAMGLDNAEHRIHQMTQAEQREALEKAMAKAVKQQSQKPTREAAVKGGRVSGPRHDVDRMVELYETLPPAGVAEEMGIHPATVIKWLKERGVFDKNKYRSKAKPPVRPKDTYARLKECGKGHDLTKPGATRERWRKLPDGSKRTNGAECVECCRLRGRTFREGDEGMPH